MPKTHLGSNLRLLPFLFLPFYKIYESFNTKFQEFLKIVLPFAANKIITRIFKFFKFFERAHPKGGRAEKTERKVLRQAGAPPPPAEFYLVKFFFLDLWIRFGKIIVKV
jgi:hypothetical protein